MGTYWGMTVAVKLLANENMLKQASLDAYEDALLAFADEGKTLSALHHMNIVRFFGTSIDPHGGLMLVMEFCERGSLFEVLQSRRNFGWPELWRFAFHCSQVRNKKHTKSEGEMCSIVVLLKTVASEASCI